MSTILIINPGNSSKKFTLYKDDAKLIDTSVKSGVDGYNVCTTVKGVQQQCLPVNRLRFNDSLEDFLNQAVETKNLENLMEIKTVALKVIAPGTFFQDHRELNEEYLRNLQVSESLAPLHITPLLKEISLVKKHLPQARLFGLSDTAFHQTIPDYIRNYSLPKSDADKHDLYRFGCHGLSVASVVERIHAVVGVDPARVIVCHVGSEVSVTAVKAGKSFDTSAGYVPETGLMMGSKAGDLDTGALLALMKKQHLKPLDAENYLQMEGGLFGFSGETDLRLLLERKVKGDLQSIKTLDSFVYQIKKKIGSFMTGMGGVDLLIFTATAGERSPALRAMITADLSDLGISLDTEKNDLCIGKNGVISQVGSVVKVAVIKSDESAEVMRILKPSKSSVAY